MEKDEEYYDSKEFDFLKHKNIEQHKKDDNKYLKIKDKAIFNENNSFEKNIRKSNLSIYKEPIPNFEGYFTKSIIIFYKFITFS